MAQRLRGLPGHGGLSTLGATGSSRSVPLPNRWSTALPATLTAEVRRDRFGLLRRFSFERGRALRNQARNGPGHALRNQLCSETSCDGRHAPCFATSRRRDEL
jgi:hypothetical protein